MLNISQPFLYPTPKRKRSGEWSESPLSKRPAKSPLLSVKATTIQSPSSVVCEADGYIKADEIEQKRKAAMGKRRQSLQHKEMQHSPPQPQQTLSHSLLITEIKGDLFSAPPTSSLAHCISQDCKLGAGIAKLFRQRFGRVDDLQRMGTAVGGVSLLQVNDRFIYNLVTKKNFWEKPTYESLQESLRAMQNHAFQHNVKEICMPKIGCGLDKLEWNKVKILLKEVFAGGITHITIYCV